MGKKFIKKFFMYLVLIMLLISIFNICDLMKEYIDSRKIYKEIQDKKESIDLYNINNDYMGWININDTPIDYPIMKGNDNEFYLTRDFNKQHLTSGSIFMDYRNEGFQDRNTVIYGHHMRDGSMFGSLKKYEYADYFEKNKYIHIKTKNNKNLIYEIFAVYVTTANDIESISINFSNDGEFNSYIQDIFSKSIYDINIKIKNTDKILTLATCSYEFDNARLIIHAKLIE